MDAVIVDPAIAEGIAAFPAFDFSPDGLALIRANRDAMSVPWDQLSDEVERYDRVVDEATGVSVRVHRPKSVSEARPCVYSIHGGGYVLGTNAMDDAKFDVWCRTLGVVGVSVEYRLAPETPYPGPLDDCYAGLRWTFDNAGELGIDPDRIGIAGVSAGGGLAAALALHARNLGEVSPAFQLLECPMIDDRQATSSSRRDGLPVWSREANMFGWQSYLGDLYGTDDIAPTAAPARETDLTGLPPALVLVGGADGFRDENIDYAMRLNQAGIQCELHVLPGAPHGVQVVADSAIAKRWAGYVEAWLRRQIAGDI